MGHAGEIVHHPATLIPFLMNMFNLLKSAILLALLLAWVPARPVAAQTVAGKNVTAIDVEYVGPQSVAPERLLSNMATKVGQPFSQSVVEDDIKNLYASGMVESIRVLTEPAGAGVRVIVKVQTRTSLGKVSFEGNTAFSEGKLRNKVEMTPGGVLDEGKVQEGQRKIQELYENSGYTGTTVSYETRASGANGFSEVVYKIAEGTKSVLRDVEFVGNTAFSSKELRKQMKSKEAALLPAIGKRGKVNEDQIDDDLEAIERFYKDRGYLNAKIVDTRRIRVDGKKVDLVVTVDEGKVYNVHSVRVSGARAFSIADLTPYLKTRAAQVFSAASVESDLQALRDYYGARGYADASVVPVLDSAGGTDVDIVYEITEGAKFFLGKIDIEGNSKTKDKVIRNEFPGQPGEVFNAPKMMAGKKRLENIGYFSNVDVSPTDSAQEGYKDVNIDVVEKPTGSLNFGAGFSSIDNLVGFVEVTQTNFDIGNWPSFTGAGQRFRAAARIGTQRRDLMLNLTEPWFLDRPLALGGEVFFRNLSFLSDYFDQTNAGGAINLRKPLGEHSNIALEYKLQSTSIDVTDNASDLLKAEDGDYLQSVLGATYAHDTRDDLFLTRTGHRVDAGVSYSGLGGDVEDFHLEGGAVQFVHLPFDSILSVEGHFHAVFGDDVPIFDREFLGGANNLRGFNFRDVGPKDNLGEPIGGQTSTWASVEYTVPIMPQLRGAVFYDMGMVAADAASFDGDWNSDAGIGLRVFLPVGPLRLDYAIPLAADEFNDSTGRFQFNIGYRF
jgi:outer membrane protein insertion porin family